MERILLISGSLILENITDVLLSMAIEFIFRKLFAYLATQIFSSRIGLQVLIWYLSYLLQQPSKLPVNAHKKQKSKNN